MKKVEDAITYFEVLLDRLGNGDSDNLVCATALEALREKRDRDVTGNNRINAEMNLQEMLTEAAKTALAYRKMLERLEWVVTRDVNAGEWVEWCPECENQREDGHTSDCELAKLLKEGE